MNWFICKQMFVLYESTTVVLLWCCSAGVGRTGTYIVVDAMLDRIQHEQTLDVYGHVTCLRAQRNYMVQTEDQYVFIYESLLDAVESGNTEVPADSLYLHVQHLTTLYVADDPRQPAVTGMELEFKVGICCMTVWRMSGKNCHFIILLPWFQFGLWLAGSRSSSEPMQWRFGVTSQGVTSQHLTSFFFSPRSSRLSVAAFYHDKMTRWHDKMTSCRHHHQSILELP